MNANEHARQYAIDTLTDFVFNDLKKLNELQLQVAIAIVQGRIRKAKNLLKKQKRQTNSKLPPVIFGEN